MKNIGDLQNELDILFGNIVSDMTQADFNLIMSFILTNFAMDFPEVYSKIYKISEMPNQPSSYKLYLRDIHDNILEVKLVIPLKTVARFMPSYDVARPVYYTSDPSKPTYVETETNNPYMVIEETAGIQLTASYINSMSTYYLPKKPMILTDNTGEYFVIVKDVVVISLVERIIDINNIPEHIYSILRCYTYAKFIDFIINQSLGNMLDMNEKIFNLMYNSIEQDLSTGDFEGVSSVSLGSLSVSFNNKINNYSNSLGSLGSNMVNPNFLSELNKMKDKY